MQASNGILEVDLIEDHNQNLNQNEVP